MLPNKQVPQKHPHHTNIWMLMIPIIFISVLFILYTFVREESATEKKIKGLVTKNESILTDVAREYQKEVNSLEKEIADLKNENTEAVDTSDWILYVHKDFPFVFLYPPEFEITNENIKPNSTELSIILEEATQTELVMLIEESPFESLEDWQKYSQEKIAAAKEENFEILADDMMYINDTKFYHSIISHVSGSIYGHYSTIDNNNIIALSYHFKNSVSEDAELKNIDTKVQNIIKSLSLNDGNDGAGRVAEVENYSCQVDSDCLLHRTSCNPCSCLEVTNKENELAIKCFPSGEEIICDAYCPQSEAKCIAGYCETIEIK